MNNALPLSTAPRMRPGFQPGRAARTGISWLVAGLFFLLAGAAWSATNMTPVTVTGFNRDIVVEKAASGPPYTNYALEFNQGEGKAYYQSGLSGQTYGLPVNGQFTNNADATLFQLQPYTVANSLVLYSNAAGTLTLPTPATYSRIAVVANSGSGTASGTATLILQFNDGSTYVTNYAAPDWFNNTAGVVLQGLDRMLLTSGVSDGGSAGNPRFYQTTINLFQLGASNKPLAALIFGMPASTKTTGIYAVSGLKASAVSLPVITNAPATGLQASTATLSGQVLSIGGETPVVTLFYGPTDGGTTAASWANSVVLGYQSGAYSQAVTSLTPNTTYYFAARAVNSGGTVWASPSKTFATLPLTLPVVTNLPASNVQGTLATLNGQVVDAGGQTPVVTLYYGPANGGANPAAWAGNVVLGVQSGSFAQTVNGLAPNTAYYFTFAATNAAGAAWASPAQTFTTGTTNAPWPYVPMLTQHNDSYRTGANLNETTLNTTNVNTNQFGLLYTRPVDDQIYAQPLIMTNVSVPGRGSRNLVIVVTVNDSVYAYDADDATVIQPYWKDSFINPPNIVPPRNTDMTGACGGNYEDYTGNIGLVGTPVIDPVGKTLYLLARTKEISGNTTNFVQKLHALDIATGGERPNSPVIVTATGPGTGDGSVNGVVTFDPQKENQRTGLALANGIVYICWASHCDWTPYHGWVIGYNATNLQPAVTFDATPNGTEGGFWNSGQAPAFDTNGSI